LENLNRLTVNDSAQSNTAMLLDTEKQAANKKRMELLNALCKKLSLIYCIIPKLLPILYYLTSNISVAYSLKLKA